MSYFKKPSSLEPFIKEFWCYAAVFLEVGDSFKKIVSISETCMKGPAWVKPSTHFLSSDSASYWSTDNN